MSNLEKRTRRTTPTMQQRKQSVGIKKPIIREPESKQY